MGKKGKVTVYLLLAFPLLTPIEADEIREEVAAMRPTVHLVLPDWQRLEVRGLTEENAAKLLEMLSSRGHRFQILHGVRRESAAKVEIAVETYGA